MMLTERDLNIVETLTCRVRILSIRQLALLRWNGNAHSARRRMEALVEVGMLRCLEAKISMTQQTSRPLAEWSENCHEPDFEKLTEAARSSSQQSVEASKLFFASRLAANLFASEFTTVPLPEELSWELRLSDAYLAFQTERKTEASYWFNPRAGYMDESGQGRPDALIADPEGVPIRAVTVFRQSASLLRSAHFFCVKGRLPYEIW